MKGTPISAPPPEEYCGRCLRDGVKTPAGVWINREPLCLSHAREIYRRPWEEENISPGPGDFFRFQRDGNKEKERL